MTTSYEGGKFCSKEQNLKDFSFIFIEPRFLFSSKSRKGDFFASTRTRYRFLTETKTAYHQWTVKLELEIWERLKIERKKEWKRNAERFSAFGATFSLISPSNHLFLFDSLSSAHHGPTDVIIGCRKWKSLKRFRSAIRSTLNGVKNNFLFVPRQTEIANCPRRVRVLFLESFVINGKKKKNIK